MTEWPLIFVSGFLGSSHCVGMCGGFALVLGLRCRSRWENLGTQGLYTLGRVFTYAVLGAVAAYGGTRLAGTWGKWINVPAVLSLVAGCGLIIQGLLSAGVRFRRRSPVRASVGSPPCLLASGFRAILHSPGWWSVFLAGLLTGFLPCGLVYAFLSLAASTGDLRLGMGTMMAFGLGTAPIMMATGVGGATLSLLTRQKLLRVAAWCVVLTGTLTLVRGLSFLDTVGSEAPPACPLCWPESAEIEQDCSFTRGCAAP